MLGLGPKALGLPGAPRGPAAAPPRPHPCRRHPCPVMGPCTLQGPPQPRQEEACVAAVAPGATSQAAPSSSPGPEARPPHGLHLRCGAQHPGLGPPTPCSPTSGPVGPRTSPRPHGGRSDHSSCVLGLTSSCTGATVSHAAHSGRLLATWSPPACHPHPTHLTLPLLGTRAGAPRF